MAKTSRDVWLAGVDGCKRGWIAAFIRPDGRDAHVRDVLENFSDLLDGSNAPAIVAVDIPIGFPEHSFGGRTPDNAVRKLLANSGSSVFPMPSRRAVFSEVGPFSNMQARRSAYQRACTVAEATSTPPKRITIYAFGIFPKIQQVDRALQSHPTRKKQVFETHPEVAFSRLNRGRALNVSKKTDAGKKIRRELLVTAGLERCLVESKPPKGANTDDLLDALVCALVACRIHNRTAKCFPDHPEMDSELGVPMAIWA